MRINYSFILIVILLLPLSLKIKAQKVNELRLFGKFSNYFDKGDFISAELSLKNLLEHKDSISENYLVATYNNLGVVSNRLGKYDQALYYINLAEESLTNNYDSEELGDIYINKARIYGIVKEYSKAIEYINQGLKVYLGLGVRSKSVLQKISTCYLNLGLTYYEKKEFRNAIENLKESQGFKDRYDLPDKPFVYLNLAKVYVEVKDFANAEKYFQLSISSFNSEFGPNYYRITSVLFDYGLFLRSTGRKQEALLVHQKALAVCLQNYGAKHPFVSLAYKLLGDYYTLEGNYAKGLEYYQQSLIAVVRDFNDTSIYSNPSISSPIFSYRLLENLKSKSHAMAMLALQQKDQSQKLRVNQKSYETINLALQVIEKIRSDYISNESKLYLADNEKDAYLMAIDIANVMYTLTGKAQYVERMYSISSLSKARVLRDEISSNELFYSKNTSDTVLLRRNELQYQIFSYNKLIQDEYQKTKPDSQKLEMWKDKLFELNRANETFFEQFKMLSTKVYEQQNITEPVALSKLQGKLSSRETIVEYFIPHKYSNGKRSLYIFTINKHSINYRKVQVDSLFTANVNVIKLAAVKADFGSSIGAYNQYVNALGYMYNTLVKPIHEDIAGSSLIIVPDEEISYLPFDAFIQELPAKGSFGFDKLHYLIFDYSISYSYSSSFIFSRKKTTSNRIASFIPTYSQSGPLSNLMGARAEANAINRGFNGLEYSDGKATEHNFKSALIDNSILHLAMHSSTDTINSKFSYLIFDTLGDTVDDGRLYNYEISMERVESPMVVLSACNTGVGNLYHGEGIMSLGRNFFLAGAPSVVNTLWDVNDEASSAIIAEFYSNLSMGIGKDEAMRLAKVKYLKTATPTYTNPYFWAAYQVLGDKSPVNKGNNKFYWLLLLTMALSSGGYLCYRQYKKGKKALWSIWKLVS